MSLVARREAMLMAKAGFMEISNVTNFSLEVAKYLEDFAWSYTKVNALGIGLKGLGGFDASFLI